MKFLSLAAITFALVACAVDTSQIPEPTPEMAMELGVEEADLHRGLATYMLHCNRCHEHVPPMRPAMLINASGSGKSTLSGGNFL